MQISGSGHSAMMQQMQAMRAQMFQKADSDKSGGLSLDEFKVAGQNMPGGAQGSKGMPKAEVVFAKIDTNGDGNLTNDEMSAMRPPFDAAGMSALLGAQESSQSEETDPASTLLNMLNGKASEKSGSSTSGGSNDLVSQLMDLLNASSEKSANAQGKQTTEAQGSSLNFETVKAQLTKAYSAMTGTTGSTLSLAA